MKLGYCPKTDSFHSVHRKGRSYVTNCKINKKIVVIHNCCIYPPCHNFIPTKSDICKTCFQENKKEIVFLLTKIKLGI